MEPITRITAEPESFPDLNEQSDTLLNEARLYRICSEIVGKTVLDVGNGLEKLHLSLAKEGKLVDIILSDEEKVNTANRALLLRQNIAYLYGSYPSYDFGKRTYDTIIFSVWDDVISPGSLVDKVKELLTPGSGKIIINVPLGLYRLHKKKDVIFHFSDLFNSLSDSFYMEDIDIYEGQWLHIAASRKSAFREQAWIMQKLSHVFAALESELAATWGNVLTLQVQLAEIRAHEKDLFDKLKAVRSSADKFEQQWQSVLSSKHYRAGAALVRIAKKPYLLFSYIFGLFRKLYHRIRKLLGNYYRQISKFLVTCLRRAITPFQKLRFFPYNGISVIIPTYRETPYFDDCINSVLHQTLKPSNIEIILSVNGKDEEYYQKLKKKYAGNERIKVIYTSKAGTASARNFALDYVTKDYLTFLDDDDYFTGGYLKELASHLDKSVQLVCGRLVDERDSLRDANTYINKELAKINGGGKTKDFLRIGSLFSSVPAKLYQTKLVKDVFCRFREDMPHTEDVLYWVDNCSKITGSIYCCYADGKEAMVRRVLENSLSRPSKDKNFKFGIEDRIPIIHTIADKIYDTKLTIGQKRFLLSKINAQTDLMLQYFHRLDAQDRKKAIELIENSDNFFLNKSKFATDKGIAFCHNFAPSADPSAYVATKRLPQICDMEGKMIKWRVISSDMSNCRSNDNEFYMFFASFVMDSHVKLPKPSYFSELAQHRFAIKAFESVKSEKVQYIYSRSMFAGSHDAAYRYKLLYPQVKWYAEFSDPIYMDTNNSCRVPGGTYTGAEAFLNNYWRDVEQMVYAAADVILFTNEKQREYMLGYNETKELNERIRRQSVVLWQPTLDTKFSSLLPSNYVLEENKIHIGYFGTFYPNRQYADMLLLLKNEKVVLHLFVSKPEDLKQIEAVNIRINKAVGHLEYLNIASRMDYLYMNDITFPGPINPYLPSKLADYLSSGTKIIALVKENSVLSGFDHPNLIKTSKIDTDFALSLKK